MQGIRKNCELFSGFNITSRQTEHVRGLIFWRLRAA
jgi:hypothetical protein